MYFYGIFRPLNLKRRSRYANFRRRRYSRDHIGGTHNGGTAIGGTLEYVLSPRVHPIFKRIPEYIMRERD